MVTNNTANRRKEQKSRALLQLHGRTVAGAEVREASLASCGLSESRKLQGSGPGEAETVGLLLLYPPPGEVGKTWRWAWRTPTPAGEPAASSRGFSIEKPTGQGGPKHHEVSTEPGHLPTTARGEDLRATVAGAQQAEQGRHPRLRKPSPWTRSLRKSDSGSEEEIRREGLLGSTAQGGLSADKLALAAETSVLDSTAVISSKRSAGKGSRRDRGRRGKTGRPQRT